MKKFLRILGVIVLILSLGFVICGLLGPKEFVMKRSIVIKAPKEMIYKMLIDFTNFKKWSPWESYDSAMIQECFGSQGQVGAGYKWKGNKQVGEGQMQTIALKENERMDIQLTFGAPFKSHPLSAFVLESNSDDATKVTWSFDQKEVPFMMRPFMLLMDMDKMVGPDYERGLANLKAFCEKGTSQTATIQSYEVKEIALPARLFIVKRMTVDMKDISDAFQKNMPATGKYVKDNKLEMTGAPCGLYFTWDTTAHKTEMATAIPVKSVKGEPKGFETVSIPETKAVTVDYYGSYDKMALAHAAISQYLKDKKMEPIMPVIEEYVTDPATEKDPSKFLTKIYYLTK